MKKILCFLCALSFVVQGTMGQSIMIVTDAPELEVEGAGNLGDYLRSLGYTVDADPGDPDQNEGGNSAFRDVLTDEEIALLESYDLVIVHRSTSSGSFDESAVFWNELQVPLLHGSSYMVRNDPARWNWVEGPTARETSQYLEVAKPDHPIFNGVELDGTRVDLYTLDQDIDYVDTGGEAGLGNGILLAETELNLGTAMAEWDADSSTLVPFLPDGIDMHSHRRVFFAMLRYFEDDGSGAISFEQYSENGLKLLANSVEYTMTGEVTGTPTAITQWSLY